MHKPSRLIILLLFFCPVLLRAQDNNLLAKLAYENAETALDAQSKMNYLSNPFWSFKNYTVSLLQNSDTMAKAAGYTYLLSILQHHPNSATLLYNTLLAPWK